jgi:hypothetical protein
MPQYAQYNPNIGPPYPVVGWYDTDALFYPNLPQTALVLVSADQWQARSTSDFWAIDADGATLVPYTLPPPVFTIMQSAVSAISTGLAISFTGSITLESTLFPTDPVTQQNISAIVTTINSTGGFPGGTPSYPMIDSNGAWHLFTLSQYLVIAGAIANYVSTLTLIASGNPFGATTLPVSTISLVMS